MGFLNKLFNQKEPEPEYQEPTDKRKAECPYCHKVLKKVPGSKTKCPHCSQFMYVRTRSKDNARVVVTGEEAEKIKEEWSIVNDCHDEYLKEKKRYSDTKEKLSKRFGQEASDSDVKWNLLQEDFMKNAVDENWGFYRNTLLEMGDHVKKRGKLEHALRSYLELCFIDINGPNNLGGIPREYRSERDIPFDPKMGFLAPGIIDYINILSKKLNQNLDDLKEIFLKAAQRHYDSLKLYPITPQDAWPKLEKELKKNK